MATGRYPYSKSPWSSVVFGLFGLPLAAIAVWSATQLAATVSAYREARRWEEVPAKLIQVEWRNVMGDSITNSVKATYEYDYQGRRYTGNRVSLYGGSDNIGSFWWDVYRELKECQRKGLPFRCYVNPADPTQALLYRDLRWEMVIFEGSYTFVFAGAGFGLLILAPIAFWVMRRKATLARAHPGKPWLWRPDWARGEIKSSAKSQAVISLAVALAVNLNTIPVGLLLVHELVNKHNWDALPWIIVPAIGLTLVAWPIVAVLRWRKFGQSVFRMASVPGVIGGELTGAIQLSARIQPESGFQLTCKQTLDRTQIKWHQEKVVAHEDRWHDDDRWAIPVLFQIPFESDPTDSKGETRWQLEVKAAVPGVDYRATFDIPVFITEQSDPEFVPDDSAFAQYAAPADPERDLREAGVLKTASPTGEGCRFDISMCRSFGYTATAVASVLWITCTGMLIFMLFGQASAYPTFLLGLVDALLLWFLLKVAFHRSVVDVSAHGLAVTSGPFGLGHRHWVSVTEIAGLEAVQFANHLAYIPVAVCHDGSQVTIAKRLPSQRLANALLQEIEKAMGNGPASQRRE